MHCRKVQRNPLHNINLLHLTDIECLPRRGVLNLAFANQSDILAHLQQSLPAVYPSIWQYDGMILDIAFGVMSIWHIARQLVQLRGADRADRGGARERIRTR